MAPNRDPRERSASFQRRWLRTTLAVGALAAASLLPALHSAPARAQTAIVQMVDIAFDPSTITIPVGGTVTWVNLDTAPHTATEDHNAWTSPVLNQGDTYSHTFDQPGVVTYYCVVHPGQMHGTIIVGGATTSLPTATTQPTASPQTTAGTGTSGAVTATPTPPVVPSPTASVTAAVYPAAGELYDESMRALKRTSSYRIAEAAVETSGGGTRTFALSGTVAPPSSKEKLTLRLTAKHRKPARTDIIQIKTKAWTRRVPADRAWKQVKASRVDRLLSLLRNPLKDLPGNSVSNLETLGPETFQGVPVWHVRGTETSGSMSGTFDALIAQQGFLPYVTVRSLSGSSTKAHVDDRITRSGFGKRVKIQPPKG